MKTQKQIAFWLFLISMFAILLFHGCENDTTSVPPQAQAVVERIGKRYVPDKRLDVYHIQLERKNKELIATGEVLNPALPAILVDSLQQAAKGFTITNRIETLPQESLREKNYGIISVSVANMYGEPRYSAELVNQTWLGTVVRLLKEDDGFYYVQNWDRYLGWIPPGSLEQVTYTAAQQWQHSPKVICIANYGTVNEQAGGAGGECLTDLVPGAALRRISDGAGYFKVETPDGRVGYVSKAAAVEESALQNIQPTRENILLTARKFLGIPYLWGGASAKGFDCSGYVQTVFRLNNFILPRDANQIEEKGAKVTAGEDFENVLPGDLLFFGPSPERITHVAIYLGDRLFIHASGSVRINSLDPEHPLYSEYRHKSLRSIKRLLSDS